eukprot:7389463-Prymnesium_polylepis.2
MHREACCTGVARIECSPALPHTSGDPYPQASAHDAARHAQIGQVQAPNESTQPPNVRRTHATDKLFGPMEGEHRGPKHGAQECLHRGGCLESARSDHAHSEQADSSPHRGCALDRPVMRGTRRPPGS